MYFNYTLVSWEQINLCPLLKKLAHFRSATRIFVKFAQIRHAQALNDY